MRYVSAIVTFLLILILVLFASSNQEEARLQLFPLPQEIIAPLYILTFLLVFVGFVTGGFVAWNAGRKHRKGFRQSQKRIQVLESDVAMLRARAEAAEDRVAQNAPVVPLPGEPVVLPEGF